MKKKKKKRRRKETSAAPGRAATMVRCLAVSAVWWTLACATHHADRPTSPRRPPGTVESPGSGPARPGLVPARRPRLPAGNDHSTTAPRAAPAVPAPAPLPPGDPGDQGDRAIQPDGPASRSLRLPLSPAVSEAPQQYSGRPVSMDFRDADVRAVLRVFAEVSGLNVVVDPDVRGRVEVALVDVPWDQALDVILRANQLAYEAHGTVIRIAPAATLAAERLERRTRAEQQALAGALTVLTRTLSFARAADLGDLVTRAVLSSRGQVQTDVRTNTLVMTDLPERLRAAEDLLDALDRPQPQVEIEARIVQASQDYLRELGVEWGIAGRVAPEIGNVTPLAFPNRGGITGRLGGRQGPEAGGGDPRASALENAGTAVSLAAPAATSALGLTLGSVDGAMNLDVILSAAENEGAVRILSNPRVTTQNNVQATIVQGDQIPIQTVANNTVVVTFRDAALRLAVTPQITSADTVIMQIEIDNDFADFGREVNGVPPIVTQSAATTVHVAHGETTVIGGIYEHERARRDRRVPGLGRLPLVGRLFRSESDRRRMDELLIFLTPYIVR